MRARAFVAVALAALALSASAAAADALPGKAFLRDCVCVCVDLQDDEPPKELAEADLPTLWREMGFTAADVNAANAFARDVALPNAAKVVEACRARQIPVVLIHWGYQFADGMDLDPDIRRSFQKEFGDDYTKWPHHRTRANSKPAPALHVQPGDYVLAKTAQDAFASCNLEFVLRNLGAKNLILFGGHTEACLGKTAQSARKRGFQTLCVRDATTNARESTREKGIRDSGFNHVVDTAFLLELLREP